MAKKPPKTPKPINVPRGGKGPKCPMCGQPKGLHTVEQLQDCLASRQ